MEHNGLAEDRLRVDRAAVLTFVCRLDIPQLKVPLLLRRSDDAEARVVGDASVFVGERERVLLQPRHLVNVDQTQTLGGRTEVVFEATSG